MNLPHQVNTIATINIFCMSNITWINFDAASVVFFSIQQVMLFNHNAFNLESYIKPLQLLKIKHYSEIIHSIAKPCIIKPMMRQCWNFAQLIYWSLCRGYLMSHWSVECRGYLMSHWSVEWRGYLMSHWSVEWRGYLMSHLSVECRG